MSRAKKESIDEFYAYFWHIIHHFFVHTNKTSHWLLNSNNSIFQVKAPFSVYIFCRFLLIGHFCLKTGFFIYWTSFWPICWIFWIAIGLGLGQCPYRKKKLAFWHWMSSVVYIYEVETAKAFFIWRLMKLYPGFFNKDPHLFDSSNWKWAKRCFGRWTFFGLPR